MQKKISSRLMALAILAVSSVAISSQASAADGKALFQSCTACHGANGISSNPEWPNLAGQKEQYLVNQMQNFKSGARKNALMEPMAKPLSDADIKTLAGYISKLK